MWPETAMEKSASPERKKIQRVIRSSLHHHRCELTCFDTNRKKRSNSNGSAFVSASRSSCFSGTPRFSILHSSRFAIARNQKKRNRKWIENSPDLIGIDFPFFLCAIVCDEPLKVLVKNKFLCDIDASLLLLMSSDNDRRVFWICNFLPLFWDVGMLWWKTEWTWERKCEGLWIEWIEMESEIWGPREEKCSFIYRVDERVVLEWMKLIVNLKVS